MNKEEFKSIYEEGFLSDKDFEYLRDKIIFEGELLNSAVTFLELFRVFILSAGKLISKKKNLKKEV